MNKTCETCRYWDEGDTENLGLCRIRSPVVDTDFPARHAGAWCGEWEAENDPALEAQEELSRLMEEAKRVTEQKIQNSHDALRQHVPFCPHCDKPIYPDIEGHRRVSTQ